MLINTLRQENRSNHLVENLAKLKLWWHIQEILDYSQLPAIVYPHPLRAQLSGRWKQESLLFPVKQGIKRENNFSKASTYTCTKVEWSSCFESVICKWGIPAFSFSELNSSLKALLYTLDPQKTQHGLLYIYVYLSTNYLFYTYIHLKYNIKVCSLLYYHDWECARPIGF